MCFVSQVAIDDKRNRPVLVMTKEISMMPADRPRGSSPTAVLAITSRIMAMASTRTS